MKNRVFVIAIALIVATSCTPKQEGSRDLGMLEDTEHVLTAEDKAIAESREPMPIPEEQYPGAGEPNPSAMLEDLEAREAVKAPTREEAARPLPAPEEPRPVAAK